MIGRQSVFSSCFVLICSIGTACAGDERERSVALNELGDVRMSQGDLTAALENYRAAMAIRERLAASDPGNAEWQRDLSISHERIGDVLAEGDLTAALEDYRAAISIRERLAASDPDNAGWQRDLSISHNKIGDVLVAGQVLIFLSNLRTVPRARLSC